MEIKNFSTSPSLLTHYLAQLRNVDLQNERMRFRENVKRISQLMAYEISKELEFTTTSINTPLGKTNGQTLTKPPVIALVLRAGLAMHQGFLEAFDEADNCFISAYRDEGDIEQIKAHIEYLASPSLENRTVILVDPMLATGKSIAGALAALLTKGKPKQIHFACIVASPTGIEEIKTNHPEINKIWVAAIDKELNNHAYIVPGLGDAGDLAYGTKS